MPKYGALAHKKIDKAVHEMKEGRLRNDRSDKKIANRGESIAVGLSELRRRVGKVHSAED